MKIPPYGKYYPCFQMYGEIERASQCTKSIALTKSFDAILNIG